MRSTNKTGYKGVSHNSRRGDFRATIMVNYRTKHLGYYETAEEAGRAYEAAAREAFGEYARIA